MKVTHIITDLAPGGAEMMLYRLLCAMDARRFENEVISLTGAGPLAAKLREAGIPVRALEMRRGIPNPLALFRLASWIRRSRPRVVQTWMYHANLLGSLAALLAGNVPVVWGIHQADLDPRWNKRLTLWTAKSCAALSRWLPSCIVFVSKASADLHRRAGYAARSVEVISNGFDLSQLRADSASRASVRRELGIAGDTPIIGMVTRFHPQKDLRNFIQAAARLHATLPNVHFVLCGRGIAGGNPQLVQWIADAGVRDRFHLLGERKDVARLFSAFDIATSSSVSEAFPLAVGEAMGCGTPCVVTDVGDSALLVGETGRVVPPSDPDALAEAWRQLLAAEPGARRRLGLAARRRIEQHFGLPAVVERYQCIYSRLAEAPGSTATALAQAG